MIMLKIKTYNIKVYFCHEESHDSVLGLEITRDFPVEYSYAKCYSQVVEDLVDFGIQGRFFLVFEPFVLPF